MIENEPDAILYDVDTARAAAGAIRSWMDQWPPAKAMIFLDHSQILIYAHPEPEAVCTICQEIRRFEIAIQGEATEEEILQWLREGHADLLNSLGSHNHN